MHTRYTKILLLLLIAIVLLIAPGGVRADGMVLRPDPYTRRWESTVESSQFAFIHHDGTRQKMLLSVGIGGSDRAAWIFPVPSAPDQIKVDVIGDLPTIQGEDMGEGARVSIKAAANRSILSQLYTILSPRYFAELTDIFSPSSSRSIDEIHPMAGFRGIYGSIHETPHDVTIYDMVTKEGVTTEVVSAHTTQGIYDHLRSRGLTLDESVRMGLEKYVGLDYSFVISWIDDASESYVTDSQISARIDRLIRMQFANWLAPRVYPKFFDLIDQVSSNDQRFFEAYNKRWLSTVSQSQNPVIEYFGTSDGSRARQIIIRAIRQDPTILDPDHAEANQSIVVDQRGVVVSFPTQDIYFPLITTSVYGDVVVPASIRVMGHVSPHIYPAIAEHTQIGYYAHGSISYMSDEMAAGMKQVYDGPLTDIKYTKIDIDAPSSSFTQDLWISRSVPIFMYFASFISDHRTITHILVLLLGSILSSLVAGYICFPYLRDRLGKLALLGIANILTLATLIIAVVYTTTKSEDPVTQGIARTLWAKRYGLWRLIGILILGLIAIHVVAIGVAVVLIDSGGIYLLRETNYMPLIVALWLSLFVWILTRCYRYARSVAPADSELVELMSRVGYSTLSFVPKDSSKIRYIIVFSLIFYGLMRVLGALV